MDIDIAAEIEKYSKEMNEAEDALAEKGEISVESWMLIKQYIFAAIAHSGWLHAKAAQELPLSAFSSDKLGI